MRIRPFLFGLLIAAIFASAGAGAAPPLVDADWLAARLGDPGIAVLDVRNQTDGGSPAVFDAGHVPGAVYSDYGTDGWRATVDGVPAMLPPVADLEPLIGGLGIGNASHVVIVPAGVSATDYGSATRIYWTFRVLGHDAVSILDGGHAGWAADPARPLAKGTVRPTAATFRARFRAELVASRTDVERALANGTALIDNRPPAQYQGEAKHPEAKRHGTIPNAVNLAADRFFDAASGRFASLTSLARLWRDQGIAKEAEQIAFCNTGHWASLGWFAAYALFGNEKARLYDGSMVEWSSRPELPMVNTTNPARQ